jgi:hypothetical protein
VNQKKSKGSRMTSRDFCYWLQGVFEVGNPETLDHKQLQVVKAHLAMVFEHEIDPSFGDKKAQDALSKIHSQGPGLPTLIRC